MSHLTPEYIDGLHKGELKKLLDALCTLIDFDIDYVSFPGETAAHVQERLSEIDSHKRVRDVAWRLMYDKD